MTEDKKDIKVGVNPIIVNNNKILLGKRKNTFGEGTYGLPGGHLKSNETIEQCAIREIQEETGLIVLEEDLKVINIARTYDRIQIGVLVNKYDGIPKIREPHKCSDLGFFDLDKLPELFSGTKVNIELYKNNEFYNKNINLN